MTRHAHTCRYAHIAWPTQPARVHRFPNRRDGTAALPPCHDEGGRAEVRATLNVALHVAHTRRPQTPPKFLLTTEYACVKIHHVAKTDALHRGSRQHEAHETQPETGADFYRLGTFTTES